MHNSVLFSLTYISNTPRALFLSCVASFLLLLLVYFILMLLFFRVCGRSGFLNGAE